MKSKTKLRGILKSYIRIFICLGLMLCAVDVVIMMIDLYAALFLTCAILIYFFVLMILLRNNRSMVMNELINFATEYGQIQKQLLKELDLPYILLDAKGAIVWTNKAFEQIVQNAKVDRKSISSLIPELTRDKLPNESNASEVEVHYENSEFVAKCRKICLTEMEENSTEIPEEEREDYLIAVYFYDVTALKIALRENDDQSLAVGLLYLDNYNEALESAEEVRRSLLTALIERKINKYVASYDGISRKMEKDKYILIMRKSALTQMQETKFDILEDVKTVNIGNEMAITLSIGIGLDGLTYLQNYEYARTAIELALGRGGDQAVVKTKDKIVYYGGKSQQVEKNTRVKARVKAHALEEIITSKERVIIMGHRLSDVDSFGAAVGIYRIAKELDRKAHIVLNDVTTSVQPLKEMFMNDDYEDDMMINSEQALSLANSSTALVVVDVNKPSITECPELLKVCNSIVVLDHHRQGTETIENATLSYVEAYASSACEMVTEILQYISDHIKIKSCEADCLYSGIIIDTNNFTTKTGVRTFEAAAYLRRAGADVVRVRKLFRDNVIEYKAKADAVSQAEIYRNVYAISTCTSEDIQSPTEVGAQAANELLDIKGIKASFVCTEYQGLIYVSARSIDEVNVQVIMERLGGGGHMNVAGCQMEEVTVDEAIRSVKNTIDEMIEEGELD